MYERRIKMRSLILIIVGLILAIPSGSVNAEEMVAKSKARHHVELEDLKNQMQKLQDQINMLESQNQEVNQKLYDAMSGEKAGWTEKFEAGYKKGLYFKSKDGNWKMKFRMRGQFKLQVDDPDSGLTETEFRVQRLRFKWNGNAFRPWFLYTIQLGARDSVTLRDMYFDFAYNKSIAPRVGQYKVPFGRDELTSSSTLQFVDRSILNDEFGAGRDRGASLNGVLGQYLAYGAGVFNGAGRNGRQENSNVMWAGRAQFMWSNGGNLKYSGGSFVSGGDYKIMPNFSKVPGGVFTAGIGFYGLTINRDQAPGKSPDNDVFDRLDELGTNDADTYTWTADLNYRHPVFNVQGGYYGRWISPNDTTGDTAYDQGFNVQAGVFVMPKTVEVAGRWSYIDYDDGVNINLGEGDPRDTVWEITGGINYYITHDHRWKIQADYSYQQEEDVTGNDESDNQLRVQLQAYF